MDDYQQRIDDSIAELQALLVEGRELVREGRRYTAPTDKIEEIARYCEMVEETITRLHACRRPWYRRWMLGAIWTIFGTPKAHG